MIQQRIAELFTLDGTHVWPPHYRKSVCWITKVPGVSRQRSVEGKTHFVLLFVREIVVQLLFARLSSKIVAIPLGRKRSLQYQPNRVKQPTRSRLGASRTDLGSNPNTGIIPDDGKTAELLCAPSLLPLVD